MAIVMVISVAASLIYYLSLGTYALEPDSEPVSRLELGEGDDLLIKVGLMYGESVTLAFRVETAVGYEILAVDSSSTPIATAPLWTLNVPTISATVDASLARPESGYTLPPTLDSIVVGGYHVELYGAMTREECAAALESLAPVLDGIGIYAFPAFIDGAYVVRVGHFTTSLAAEYMMAQLKALGVELEMRVASPSRTAVSIVNHADSRILFELDYGNISIGLAPLENADGSENYLVTPAGKSYDGIFMFSRYNSDTNANAGKVDGVALTDVIELGDYIKGVLPYEVSASWPLETLKAFAICVRSFTLSGLGRHEKAYGVDMCNTQHCQVYNGRARINDNVILAVDETDSLVLGYNGEIVTAFYSAVQGGVTVSSEDAWGGKIEYLQAVETPWEIFTDHSEGVWQSEVSPAELAEYLRGKGYTQIKGSIASIEITELAKNSTYVKALTVTDVYGSRVTINRTDTVRNALAKYVNSANFVVGKGSVEADITTFATSNLTSTAVAVPGYVLSVENSAPQIVLTASGAAASSELGSATVVTGAGQSLLGKLSSHTERQVVTASKASNFIFVGKGWGHGVGISQIGLRDLAKQGYKADEMLYKYFTGITIAPYGEIIEY